MDSRSREVLRLVLVSFFGVLSAGWILGLTSRPLKERLWMSFGVAPMRLSSLSSEYPLMIPTRRLEITEKSVFFIFFNFSLILLLFAETEYFNF